MSNEEPFADLGAERKYVGKPPTPAQTKEKNKREQGTTVQAPDTVVVGIRVFGGCSE